MKLIRKEYVTETREYSMDLNEQYLRYLENYLIVNFTLNGEDCRLSLTTDDILYSLDATGEMFIVDELNVDESKLEQKISHKRGAYTASVYEVIGDIVSQDLWCVDYNVLDNETTETETFVEDEDEDED